MNKKDTQYSVISVNRSSRYNYELGKELEAGICLSSSDVKSLRHSSVNLSESHVGPIGADIFLQNANIARWGQVGPNQSAIDRNPRKLLVHHHELRKLLGQVTKAGMTIVPLKLYFNNKGRVKILISLGKGKKLYDKRNTEKNRDWNRDKQRILKQRS